MNFCKIENAQVVVLGNEKGGTGKSTTALHIVVGRMRDRERAPDATRKHTA